MSDNKLNIVVKETTEEIIMQLLEKGFEKMTTRGNCVYYRKDGEKYALAVMHHRNDSKDKVVIIVEDAEVSRLGYPCIILKSRHDSKKIPCIRYNGKLVALHRHMLNVASDIDHINSNVYVCIFDNLRPATQKQNCLNTRRMAKIREYEYREQGKFAGYGFEVRISENQAEELVQIGFTVKIRNRKRGEITMQSPLHMCQVRAYQDYTKAEKILLKGTDMEQYVYDIQKDFSQTMNLLIHYYILHDITEEEIYEMNLLYWSMRLDNDSVV